MKLPTGYRILWAGEFEELQQAKARLEIIVPISLLMILLLLYGLFNSMRDSLMALAGIPFAAPGSLAMFAAIRRASSRLAMNILTGVCPHIC